jgi:hypothetical protein
LPPADFFVVYRKSVDPAKRIAVKMAFYEANHTDFEEKNGWDFKRKRG